MKFVSHQHAAQLLHNKFVVVLGDSIQRGVYKDIVLLLQKENFLSNKQLKTKGELSFEQDCLVEGGSLKPMSNGTGYREVRQYQSDHHLGVLSDFRNGLKPDVVIVNSCVWDISRYNSDWKGDYNENLQRFFQELREVLPKETLTIWNLTMPLGQNIRGGFLVPEIEHKAPQLRCDVIQANFLSWTLANSFGVDVLDLHYHFRHSLQHRTNDGIHWNALAHRCMTSLLLLHAAQAWGVVMPCPVTRESGNSRDFTKDFLTPQCLSFEENAPQPLRCKSGKEKRPTLKHHSRWNHGPPSNRNAWFTDFTCCPADYYDHENRLEHHHRHRHHQHVMRNRHRKTYYAPYY